LRQLQKAQYYNGLGGVFRRVRGKLVKDPDKRAIECAAPHEADPHDPPERCTLCCLGVAGISETQRAKFLQVRAATDALMKLAKKYRVKLGFGTDLVYGLGQMLRQNREFTLRARWFSPLEILRQATLWQRGAARDVRPSQSLPRQARSH
jgi:imidazolonepropionase-like amidohydrolase